MALGTNGLPGLPAFALLHATHAGAVAKLICKRRHLSVLLCLDISTHTVNPQTLHFRYTTRTHLLSRLHSSIHRTMASTNPPLAPCTVCAKPATTHCAGCVSEEITKNLGHHTPRLYCGKECQRSDWESHKKPCNLVQAQAKLFRAGDILKEVFLATRAEALDLHLAEVECSGDDEIQIYDSAEASSFDKVGPLLVTLPDDEKVKHAVVSYRAGVDALAGVMDALGKQLLNGKRHLKVKWCDLSNVVQTQATLPKSKKSTFASSLRK